ncbi:YdaS family helix-turn-helix protein [Paraburkholderia sp. 31.1]|uniref:YdaS family helix-turn-helix protein n=1 Tax=Paraburkholderia sp. 31.1 TaxID=2615205 RepID=UPI00165510C2|nr:YdaS family helix-turn-helix protein [Paraburkholderia sp. 31.1]
MTRSIEAVAIARSYPGMHALIRAVEICGSHLLLSQAIGVRKQNIANWLHVSRMVPLEYVPSIVAVANDPEVTPWTLRPDFAQGWALLARQLRTSSPGSRDGVAESEALTE